MSTRKAKNDKPLTPKQMMDRADFAARRHFAMHAPTTAGGIVMTFDMLPGDDRSILYHSMYAALLAIDNEWRPVQ